MSTHDISRSIFDPRKQYSSVRMQQGRPIIDDDWNENERIENEERRRTRLDLIGAHGTSNDGFRISHPVVTGEKVDFTVHAGTYYIGGMRFDLAEDETYRTQSDWLQQDNEDTVTAPDGERMDLVYLEGWEQSVSAREDSELLEVALGGADTSGRMRMMHRIRVAQDVTTDECEDAWNRVTGNLLKTHDGHVNESHEVNAGDHAPRLRVTFSDNGSSGDLCTPSAVGGYLGAENQALRVQLRSGQRLTWGYDNASSMYRVRVSADGKTVTMITHPPDQTRWPQKRHVVEILPWSAVLSNNEKVAAVEGPISGIEVPYDPTSGSFTLRSPIPDSNFGRGWEGRPDADELCRPSPGEPDPENAVYFFMRVWDRGSEEGASRAEIGYALDTPIALEGTGVVIRIGNSFGLPGDHWIVALRPETRSRVVPWEMSEDRSPDGIRRFRAPLALIRWTEDNGIMTGTVHDCRQRFRPLTRLGTCCTVTVGDGMHSHGDYMSIQEAIESLPPSGGEVCVRPGHYEEAVRIDDRQRVRIRGCGSRTIVVSLDDGPTPVIQIRRSRDIAIESLRIVARAGTGIAVGEPEGGAIRKRRPGITSGIVLRDLRIEAGERSAVFIRRTRDVRLLDSLIAIRPLASPQRQESDAGRWPAVYVGARDARIEGNVIETVRALGRARTGILDLSRTAHGGLQIAGGSENIDVRRNRIRGGNGHGVTLGSLSYEDQKASGSPAADFKKLLSMSYMAFPPNTLYVGPTGCIVWPDDPEPPKGPEGDPLVPTSDGPLRFLRIMDNEIAGMGGDGIGVARFFDLNKHKDIISVDALLIAGNMIRECCRIPRRENEPGMAHYVGHGGIALADSENLVIRNNRIENNGLRSRSPICGIFLYSTENCVIEGNAVVNNGAGMDDPSRLIRGNRGGVVIVNAQAVSAVYATGTLLHTEDENLEEKERSAGPEREETESGTGGGVHHISGTPGPMMEAPPMELAWTDARTGESETQPFRSLSGVYIRHNVVLSPLGHALKLVGTGTFAIHGNRLVCQGAVPLPRELAALQKYWKPVMNQMLKGAAIDGKTWAQLAESMGRARVDWLLDALCATALVLNWGGGLTTAGTIMPTGPKLAAAENLVPT